MVLHARWWIVVGCILVLHGAKELVRVAQDAFLVGFEAHS